MNKISIIIFVIIIFVSETPLFAYSYVSFGSGRYKCSFIRNNNKIEKLNGCERIDSNHLWFNIPVDGLVCNQDKTFKVMNEDVVVKTKCEFDDKVGKIELNGKKQTAGLMSKNIRLIEIKGVGEIMMEGSVATAWWLNIELIKYRNNGGQNREVLKWAESLLE